MRKIIAVDIDGTLVDEEKNISQVTKKALLRAQELGHVVVIVTGRHPKGVEGYAKDLDFERFGGLVSNFNGARVWSFKSGKDLVDHKIDQDLARAFLSLSRNLPAHHIFYKNDKIYTEAKDSMMAKHTGIINRMEVLYDPNLLDKVDLSFNSIVLCHEDIQVLDYVEERIREKFDSYLNIVRSTPNYLETMPLGINKGTSLLEIAKYYGQSKDDIIAFGDELNDIEMFKTAGRAVAMANANPIIKDLADYVTLSNEDDGIAYYLEKFNII